MKSFSKGQVFASTTDSLTGQVSLEEFSWLMKQQEKTDELRQFGLTDEEISIKLKHDKVCNTVLLIVFLHGLFDLAATAGLVTKSTYIHSEPK